MWVCGWVREYEIQKANEKGIQLQFLVYVCINTYNEDVYIFTSVAIYLSCHAHLLEYQHFLYFLPLLCSATRMFKAFECIQLYK